MTTTTSVCRNCGKTITGHYLQHYDVNLGCWQCKRQGEEQMKNVNSYKVSNNLYINSLLVGASKTKVAKPSNINHIVVIDCSGSMYGELNKIAAALKAKVPTLVREGDTLSIIWFSGRGQFGPILEGQGIADLRDLAKVNTALDRYLRPVGLTGFKEPLEEVAKMIGRIQKTNNNQFSLFFMSDGMDNQWSRPDILKVCEQTARGLVSSTFVEYGWYADRPMLTAMAEKAGGQLVHADDFAQYEPLFEAAITKQVNSGGRTEVGVPKHAIGGIVFEMTDGNELVTYDATSGTATVDMNTQHVWYLSEKPDGQEPLHTDTAWAAEYAAMSLFAVRMKPDIVFGLLKGTGDVRFIKAFANCFGKQAYSAFMDATKAAAFNSSLRNLEGNNPNLVPPDDAYTVFDLLKDLESDDRTRLLLDHDAFDYKRISRATVDADENFGAKEKARIKELQEQMSKAKSATDIQAIQKELNDLMSTKQEALKFESADQPGGYELASLTYNEESPNISVLVKKKGTVDLSKRRDAAVKNGDGSQKTTAMLMSVPDKFETFIYRNYSIIAHGIVNVKTLPVIVHDDIVRKLNENNVKYTVGTGDEIENVGQVFIDLTSLPVLNRKQVKSVTLKETAEIAAKLQRIRAHTKVFKDYVKDRYPGERLVAYTATYGADATDWLKAQGITEYSGFNPSKVQAEATDFIIGKELSIKLKGYSSLPPVAKVKEKIAAKGKLNGPESMMAEAINEIEAFLKAKPEKLHRAWLTGKEKTLIAEGRALSFDLSQIVFSIIVGQVWFSDCPTLDDKTVSVTVDGTTFAATAEMKEVEIKL